MFEATEKAQTAKLGDDHPDTLRTRASLAATYVGAGRMAEAITLFEPTLKALDVKLGPEHGVTVACRYNLAAAYRAAGRTAESIELLEATLKIMVPKYSHDDPETLWVRGSLAESLRAAGRVAESIPMFEGALRAIEPKLTIDNFRTLEIRANLAKAYDALGQFAKMEPLARKELESARRRFGPGDSRNAPALSSLGECLLHLDRAGDAEVLLRECLALRESAEPGVWTTAGSRSLLGAALLAEQRYPAAEPLIVSGYEGLKAREAAIPAGQRMELLSKAADRVVKLYESWCKPDQAAAWRMKLGVGDLPNELFARPATQVGP